MDSRYHDLRTTTAYEGLSAAERTAALDYLEAPAQQAYLLACLLRGALADRGNLLDSLKAARMMGLSAGRVLLAGLLANNSQCLAQPHAALTADEWQRGKAAYDAPTVTCNDLLDMLLRTRRAIATRQRLTTLKSA